MGRSKRYCSDLGCTSQANGRYERGGDVPRPKAAWGQQATHSLSIGVTREARTVGASRDIEVSHRTA